MLKFIIFCHFRSSRQNADSKFFFGTFLCFDTYYFIDRILNLNKYRSKLKENIHLTLYDIHVNYQILLITCIIVLFLMKDIHNFYFPIPFSFSWELDNRNFSGLSGRVRKHYSNENGCNHHTCESHEPITLNVLCNWLLILKTGLFTVRLQCSVISLKDPPHDKPTHVKNYAITQFFRRATFVAVNKSCI